MEFPDLESSEIEVWVMDSHGKAINFLRMNRAKKDKSENPLIPVKKSTRARNSVACKKILNNKLF